MATRCARWALIGGPDYVGEEHVLRHLEHFLLDAGLGEEAAATAKQKLKVSDFGLDPGCPEDPRAVARAPLPDDGSDGSGWADLHHGAERFGRGGSISPTSTVHSAERGRGPGHTERFWLQ